MKCPLKFGLYEFEGGEECIGAECGFFGSVCGSVDAHSKAQSKDAPTLSEQPELLSDSREKLEADAGELTADYASSGDVCDALYRGIIKLLDRQAAITERKHLELACAFQLESDKRITDLQAKVGELTEQLEAAHAKNRALKAHISKMQSGRHGWHVKGVELEKENAELQAAYDELTGIAAQLCRACGFSMCDAAGEVIS